MTFLIQLIDFYTLIVVVAVLISWFRLPRHNPVVKFLNALTEPLLAPIRRVLPPLGGLDFTPMVLIVGLQLVKRFLYYL